MKILGKMTILSIVASSVLFGFTGFSVGAAPTATGVTQSVGQHEVEANHSQESSQNGEHDREHGDREHSDSDEHGDNNEDH